MKRQDPRMFYVLEAMNAPATERQWSLFKGAAGAMALAIVLIIVPAIKYI